MISKDTDKCRMVYHITKERNVLYFSVYELKLILNKPKYRTRINYLKKKHVTWVELWGVRQLLATVGHPGCPDVRHTVPHRTVTSPQPIHFSGHGMVTPIQFLNSLRLTLEKVFKTDYFAISFW